MSGEEEGRSQGDGKALWQRGYTRVSRRIGAVSRRARHSPRYRQSKALYVSTTLIDTHVLNRRGRGGTARLIACNGGKRGCSIWSWNPGGGDLPTPKDPEGCQATDRAKGLPGCVSCLEQLANGPEEV